MAPACPHLYNAWARQPISGRCSPPPCASCRQWPPPQWLAAGSLHARYACWPRLTLQGIARSTCSCTPYRAGQVFSRSDVSPQVTALTLTRATRAKMTGSWPFASAWRKLAMHDWQSLRAMHTAALSAAQPSHQGAAISGKWPQSEGLMSCSDALLQTGFACACLPHTSQHPCRGQAAS